MIISNCCKVKAVRAVDRDIWICTGCMQECIPVDCREDIKIKPKRQKRKSKLEEKFMLLINENGIDVPVREYKFCPERRWRLDFAWIDCKLGVEIDGGVWSNGRHNRGSGFIKDMEKLNMAVKLGWKVLRYHAGNLETAIDDIKSIVMNKQ